MYLNQATIIGNLTRDPELKKLPNGTDVANFSIATNESYKDKDGNKVESVQYHNCVAFGKPAELIALYMKKGSSLYVQGKLQTSSWDDKDSGKKMYKTEIVVRDFQFGAKKDGATTTAPTAEAKTTAPTEGVEYPEEDIDPDDIPF
jgi:single-strand DNA-binding protein